MDGLETPHGGSVECQAVLEDVLVERLRRDREVLFDAGQVREADIDVLDVLFRDVLDDLFGRGERHACAPSVGARHGCWAPASDQTLWIWCCPSIKPMFRGCYTCFRPAVRSKRWYKSPRPTRVDAGPPMRAYPGAMARMTAVGFPGLLRRFPKVSSRSRTIPGNCSASPNTAPAPWCPPSAGSSPSRSTGSCPWRSPPASSVATRSRAAAVVVHPHHLVRGGRGMREPVLVHPRPVRRRTAGRASGRPRAGRHRARARTSGAAGVHRPGARHRHRRRGLQDRATGTAVVRSR